MLVLSRLIGEQIVVNDNIIIHIVNVRGKKIYVGLEAPKSVSIHRKEVYDAIQRERKARTSDLEKSDM